MMVDTDLSESKKSDEGSNTMRWLITYPLNFGLSLYLKIKYRMKGRKDYAAHQKEFFAMTFRGDRNDTFWSVRTKVAQYAVGTGETRALDVGTGHRFQAVALKRAGIEHVVGIDLVDERIKQSREQFGDLGIEFIAMDCTELGFPKKSFDCITVSAVLHDLPDDVRQRAIAEMARVCRGRIVIYEPRTFRHRFLIAAYGFLGELLDESIYFYDFVRNDLDASLLKAGLRVVLDENVLGGTMNIKVCEPAYPHQVQRYETNDGP